MAIGIDEEDLLEGEDKPVSGNDTQKQDSKDPEPPATDPISTETQRTDNNDDDFISYLLKSREINDRSKIKFENEEGSIEEVDWNSLSNEDKLNILNSSAEATDNDLDESELQLISAIRQSGLTPAEYLQHIQNESIDRYIQNNANENRQYSVDQYDDDELFMADFISRMGDVTQEEAKEALENAKANPALFSKQMEAIRAEYKTIEDENLQQAQIEQEQLAQEQFDQFSEAVVDQINDLTEYGGYDLNLENQDMQELYDFITGTDAAGNNHFAKALSDPKTLVQTAWLALNGEKMIDDITKYFQKEITRVRQESYNKGLEDAKKTNQSQVVYIDRPGQQSQQEYNDLDDF